MTPRILAQALAITLLLWPVAAMADPPDLDVPDIVAGESELEVNAWRGDHVWLVRPELSVALNDRIVLQLQTDVGRQHGEAAKVRDLSVQFMLVGGEGSPLGLAAEAGIDPSRHTLRGEVLLFAEHEAGPWNAAADMGLEQEGRSTRYVYAWRVRRELGARWTAAVEGGGGGGFRSRGDHFAGVTFGKTLDGPGVELRLGWLVDLAGHDNLAKIGFTVPL